MSNGYETMLADHFEHGFAVDWMRKDLRNCLSTANENGASMPVTALVDQFYRLRTDNQNITVAAMAIAERNTLGHRS
jgi:3-hydroxyisobutyrate dehydrogenase-like beta-hydroxyacid dehydrogenase